MKLTDYSFKTLTRVYGTSELWGHDAVVHRENSDRLVIYINDVAVILKKEVDRKMFFEYFLPDFSTTPRKTVYTMLAGIRTIKSADKEVRIFLETFKDAATTWEVQVQKPIINNKPIVCRRIKDGSNGIKISNERGLIQLVQLTQTGLDLVEFTPDEYQTFYKELPTFPLKKAAELFFEYSKYLGADEHSLLALSKFATPPTKEVTKMAVNKKKEQPVKEPPVAEKKVATKTKTTTTKKPTAQPKAEVVKPEPKASAKKPAAKSEPKPSVTKKSTVKHATDEDYKSVSQMFQALVRAGGQTDNEIFLAVQRKFGLDDSKKGYVQWWRSNLRRKGEKIPDPIK